MSILEAVYRGLIGLFIDDGFLAVAILAVVVLAGIVRALAPEAPLQAGAFLLLGCLCVLVGSVLRAVRS
jgi:hypothetical protein